MEKELIPKQLDITILTNVPGKEEFKYSPSMTIQTTTEKKVNFNPLYKLSKSVVDNVPAGDNRVKQFFSNYYFRGLFRGMPARNLSEATELGYVDNNIVITLATIFPVKSVIYLDKNPYVICDVQWTTGNWRIKIEPSIVLYGPNYIKKGGASPTVISYEIKIELMLFPGTELTQEQLDQIKCSAKYNSISRNYAILTGRTYRPPVNYNSIASSDLKNLSKTRIESDVQQRRREEDDELRRMRRNEDDDIFRRRRTEDDELYNRRRELGDYDYYKARNDLVYARKREDDELRNRRRQDNEELQRIRREEDALRKQELENIQKEARKKEEEEAKKKREEAQANPTQTQTNPTQTQTRRGWFQGGRTKKRRHHKNKPKQKKLKNFIR